jgi:hypothetical protein
MRDQDAVLGLLVGALVLVYIARRQDPTTIIIPPNEPLMTPQRIEFNPGVARVDQ